MTNEVYKLKQSLLLARYDLALFQRVHPHDLDDSGLVFGHRSVIVDDSTKQGKNTSS